MYYPVCNDTELISNNVQFAKRENFELKLNITYSICYFSVCSVFRKMTPLYVTITSKKGAPIVYFS